jgi:hypothetical protein
MLSPRLAKIAAAMFHLIGGSLAEPAEAEGPPCSCERCEQAWWRNQSSQNASPMAMLTVGTRRVDRLAGPE